jgi:hypothetical protein
MSTHGERLYEPAYDTKISDEFAERLAALPRNQCVRAIVLPAPYMLSNRTNGANGDRPSSAERQAIIREARRRTEETFAEIDAVLARSGGQRVTGAGNTLGFIVVETTPEGIDAICRLEWVGTVLEDQPIHLLRLPNQPDERPAKPAPRASSAPSSPAAS